MQGQRSMPILQVRDVTASAEFYRDALGFSIAGSWNNEDGSVNFSIIVMDQITIGLMRDTSAAGTGENWAGYFYLSDIKAFADHVEGNGHELARGLVDQFYGCRDCEIIDIDKNRLCFGQDLTPGDKGPGL